MALSALTPDQDYSFAIKTFDQTHNISDLSNVVTLTVGQDLAADFDCDLPGPALFAANFTAPWPMPMSDLVL